MFTFLKKNISKMAVIIAFGLAAICCYQKNKIDNLNNELDGAVNNYEYYKSLTSSLDQDNRTLQLSIDQLNASNDSLIREIKEEQKKLKIKDKSLQQAQVINTVIRDTVTTTVQPKEVDFTKELKLNSLTTIIVNKKDSILSAVLDLRNQQILFIESKKEYRNKYKNWFQRLIHFDFKKYRVENYQIVNSNDLIKVTDTRIVKIK